MKNPNINDSRAIWIEWWIHTLKRAARSRAASHVDKINSMRQGK